jgi:hypothetical protein
MAWPVCSPGAFVRRVGENEIGSFTAAQAIEGGKLARIAQTSRCRPSSHTSAYRLTAETGSASGEIALSAASSGPGEDSCALRTEAARVN